MASSRRNRIDWRTVIQRINKGKFTPIISHGVYFPGTSKFVQAWAEEIAYPFMLDHHLNIAQVAQYLSATSRDDLMVKDQFLDFSKRFLLNEMRQQAPPEQVGFLDTLEDELFDITFSQMARRLDYPKYEDEFDNPLRILAELPLPVYLTTSFYDFLENELINAGKKPRSEIFYWYDALREIESVFDSDPDYQPSPEEPLVFHLHGIDTYPSSLVLTENEHLDFLVRATQQDSLPNRVTQSLTDSSLLLLGFQLDDWSFKVVFRGLVTGRRAIRRLFSISIQIDPEELDEDQIIDTRDALDYLERYFDKANFDIYWGEPLGFVQELWQNWER